MCSLNGKFPIQMSIHFSSAKSLSPPDALGVCLKYLYLLFDASTQDSDRQEPLQVCQIGNNRE